MNKFYIEPEADRHPLNLPLADGWEWYRFSDGMLSSRWITNGEVYRCTHCGLESTSFYSIRRHNANPVFRGRESA